MRFSERASRLGTESAFEVLARAKALEAQGREVIHLEIGEPDFDTPGHIIEAAVKAMRSGHTHYTPAAGIPELRQTIARYVSRTRGIEAGPEQVVVTPGAKPIMFYTILALLDPGDEALYPNPGFPIYESMIAYVGATPVPLPLREEKGFSFDLDEFLAAVNDRTRLIILNSPQNPTGGVIPPDDLRVIADTARQRDIIVLSDEVYDRLLYEGEHHSILSLPGMQDRTVLLNGFSKSYAMTGWRLGYGLMPEPLARHVEDLMVNSNSCTSAFTQLAGIAALEGPQDDTQAMVDAFRQRREIIVKGLNQIPGFSCIWPAGAFYAFPNVQETGTNSRELADYLLLEAGVAVLDGACFGRFGDGYLRLSYANSVENIQRALERIDTAVRAL